MPFFWKSDPSILRVSIQPLFWWSTLPKTCTSTRWRRCGNVCIVAFGTTTFFVSDSCSFFVFVFFTITNTKDPVEKTFCFTGNKKIIYASVKCKNLLPLFIQPNQASLEFTETHRWLLYFYTPLRWEEWKDSPNRQNPIALYHVSGVDE